MQQRPLIAVALVAACITAAGTGGYIGMRQLASTPAPTMAVAPTTAVPAAGRQRRAEGTEVPIEPAQPTAARKTAASPQAREIRPARPIGRSAEAPRPSAAASRRTAQLGPEPAPPIWRRPARTATPAADTRASLPAAHNRDVLPVAPDAGSARHGGAPIAATPGANVTPEWREPAVSDRRLVNVTIPADSVVGLRLESSVSSATARIEDPVRARVTRDVLSGGSVVIPAGSRVLGSVTLVDEGGKVRERARLGVRFHTLVLADGTELRLPTETVYRDGESPAGRSAARIGGAAAGGAILGAILGGGKGAAIGAAAGAGGGTALTMAGTRQPAELRSGQSLTVRVSDAVSAEIEK